VDLLYPDMGILCNEKKRQRQRKDESIMGFKEIKTTDLQFNPFSKIGNEWMLITAGDREKFNTMTASWGGVGVLWSENVVTTYIRPGRYTKEFIDANDTFTISFLNRNTGRH
jgi:flavin reductase (DIM6/NTAB) family NADH-FMN oxidoreductase RutF